MAAAAASRRGAFGSERLGWDACDVWGAVLCLTDVCVRGVRLGLNFSISVLTWNGRVTQTTFRTQKFLEVSTK